MGFTGCSLVFPFSAVPWHLPWLHRALRAGRAGGWLREKANFGQVDFSPNFAMDSNKVFSIVAVFMHGQTGS